MTYDANGIYSLPVGYRVTVGDDVLPSQHNPPFEDVEAALSLLLLRDGRAAMTGALEMGANKITHVADGTNPQDAVTFGQLSDPAIMRKLGEASVTSVGAAVIDLTEYIADGYRRFWLRVTDWLAATDGADAWLEVSTSSGASWLDDGYQGTVIAASGEDIIASGSGVDIAGTVIVARGVNNVSGLRGELRFEPSGPGFSMEGILRGGFQGAGEGMTVIGAANQATGVNAIRMRFSTGNVASFVGELYGAS
ncbi:hypothetical protein FHS55_002625 [Angulomicrobium tetraedrale]|uniref:Trimeric autotransporter adhesin YadA-like stalk domain-containing protein n=1 Tax=Ancylobacter tetraedralis TaxID=217068 RepID=A0A839ZBD4_9HYPH|nr:hypothetical protein [Ancylobacter tetraedralis]MBB3772016.1 hypothetical protein [Ancylobacter tetraedralis]